MSSITAARRDILDRELYNFRGVQMVDLVHASRGCRFNCFPCCTPYLGGRSFRPRPLERVVEEIESIDNNRLFIVDNSLAQDDEWLKALFRELAPLKKKWISHPIKDDDEILDLAARAGCWYTYQAVVDDSAYIRRRIERVKERGNPPLDIIGILPTIVDRRTNIARDSVAELRHRFGEKVLPEIPERAALEDATTLRQDIFAYKPNDGSAKAYDAVAAELVRRVQRWKAEKEKSSG